MHKTSIVILLFLLNLTVFAQTTSSSVEMADIMRSNGKIYVVVAVSTIILTGLILYLINLDKRIRRIEKEIES
jgi:hypothetical protein